MVTNVNIALLDLTKKVEANTVATAKVNTKIETFNVKVINAKLAAIDAKTDTLAIIKAETEANKNEILRTKDELSTLRELCMIDQNTMHERFKGYDQQFETTRIRNDEIKELQARVAALTEKEKQVDEIRTNLQGVSAAAEATLRIEKKSKR